MDALVTALRRLGLLEPDERADELTWRALAGGYHNDVALVGTRAGELVLKHFVAGSTNPLYPQMPAAELCALQRLLGTGIAPEPMGYADDVGGRALLVYRFVPGAMWTASNGVADVGRLLRRLHDQRIVDGFRALPVGDEAVLAQARSMLSGLATPSRLRRHLAPGSSRAIAERTLIHTDCGPGNIVCNAESLCLIDWQCPGIGDPVEDLANFTSAAIQVLYHQPPLVPNDVGELLGAYGDSPSVASFAWSRWPFHARLAAYCVYRAAELAHDDPDVSALYLTALEAELDLLETRP